jgi:hypothetical protein
MTCGSARKILFRKGILDLVLGLAIVIEPLVSLGGAVLEGEEGDGRG